MNGVINCQIRNTKKMPPPNLTKEPPGQRLQYPLQRWHRKIHKEKTLRQTEMEVIHHYLYNSAFSAVNTKDFFGCQILRRAYNSLRLTAVAA